MKSILLAGVLLFAFSWQAAAQDLPMPSPMGTTIQKVGLTTVTVEYSRPSVKGRTIWGDLVPYDKMWRTGANANTKVTFDTPVKINGTELEAGTYSLFTIPGEETWTVVLNSRTDYWGTGNYEEAKEVARFTVKPGSGAHVESLLFTFDNIKAGSADLILHWEKVHVSIPIEVDYVQGSIANIENKLKELDGKFRVYNSAARFYLDNELDPKKALEYAMKSTELEKRFWNVKILSEAYAANGDYKMAIETAEESLKMSEEAEYAPYIKMNQENLDKWKSMR